jgi:hypothetical protein
MAWENHTQCRLMLRLYGAWAGCAARHRSLVRLCHPCLTIIHTSLPKAITAPTLVIAVDDVLGKRAVSRDYEPVPGQWYENLEEEEPFRVLTMDEDSELVEIEYLDGDIEEIDLETWHEMDLELTTEPEGWAESQAEEDDDDEDWEEDDDDDDDDDDLDEDEDETEDREQY